MSGEPDFIEGFEKIDDLFSVKISKSDTQTKVAALGISFCKEQRPGSILTSRIK